MLHDRKTESLANFSLHFHTACGIIKVAVYNALAEQSANEPKKERMGYAMRKKLTALLLACLLLVCLVQPVSAADAPALLWHGQCSGRHGHSHTQSSRRQRRAQRSLHAQLRQLADAQQDRKGSAACSANTKEKGKVVCNWVGGAAESDQAVLTLTFTNAATKSYTFKVSGAKVTDQEL